MRICTAYPMGDIHDKLAYVGYMPSFAGPQAFYMLSESHLTTPPPPLWPWIGPAHKGNGSGRTYVPQLG